MTEYDKLVAKVNGIDNTNFVSRTKYEKDGSDFEDKINKMEKKEPDISSLVKKKTDFKTKVTEIECKIPIITGLATNSELSAVENKIPNITSLVKKTDFNIKTTEIEGKIPGVSSLVKKTDFDTKLKTVSDRVTKNKAKHLLVENKLKKLQKLDSAYFSR